jgi:hypothetical protein
MIRQRLALPALVVVAMFGIGTSSVEAADLASAKALYASAEFEEALAMLESLRGVESPEVIEQFRALCLLGLGRSSDAERALEQLVMLSPRHQVGADVSPRLLTMFRSVRERVLPAAARELYASAKADFDAGRHAQAATKFKELIAITREDDLTSELGAELRDYAQLADGFLSLSELALVKLAAPAAPAPAADAPVVRAEADPVPSVPAPPEQFIFSSLDTDVVPPREVSKRMPPWAPSSRVLRESSFRGLLEILIDEQGLVQASRLITPVTPSYDRPLLDAARSWRFTPATRQGQPVKYLKILEIVLSPAQ